MGCVREPEEDWLRIEVPPELEVSLKPTGLYRLTARGRAALDEQFNLNREYRRMAALDKPSPWDLKVFVVYRGTKARPVVDMRKLNAAMIGDVYPLPQQEEVIQAMQGMRWLGSADITSAFYQCLIYPAHRYCTAISTHRGREVFNVSIMGGKTSVQHQQRLMDTRLIQRLSWRGACCYVDDIVMYAPSFADFLGIVDEVFSILGNLGITLKAKKCFLGFHSLEILGYLVDRLGLTTAEAKADVVQNIPYPATLSQLEYFIGLTNWNRHLIPYYAQRIAPLQACKTLLLKGAPPTSRGRKDYAARTAVPTDAKLVQAYDDVKNALASRPRLYHVVDNLPIYAFVDSSKEYGTGLAVYQLTGDPEVYSKNRLVPLHFMSKPLTDAETRYWPTHLEMSGLVWAAKRMRPYMERAFVTFVTDHHSNVALCTMQGLDTASTDRSSLRLHTWVIYLDQYRDRMHVVYSKGADLECPDALSRLRYEITSQAEQLRTWARKLGASPEMEEFEVNECFAVTRLKGKQAREAQIQAEANIPAATTASSTPTQKSHKDALPENVTDVMEGMGVELAPAYMDQLRSATQNSQRMRAIFNTRKLEGIHDPQLKALTIPATCQYALRDGLLYLIDPRDRRLRLVLSSQELCKQQLSTAHDETHCSFYRTYKRLTGFYWPSIAKNIATYLAHCPACFVNKPARHKPYGKLSPIVSPLEPFDTITIDLIMDLPPCSREGSGDLFNTIMTVTDKFSKAVRFIPGRKDWSAVDWSKHFYEDVVLNGWGFPLTIMSDRDKRFLSGLWQALLSRAGVRSLTTTAYHPNADGQSERTNQTLEVMLCYLVNSSQSDWLSKLLPLQAACNNMEAVSTKKSPNELIYGKKLRTALKVATVPLPTPAAAIPLHELRTVAQEEAATGIAIAQRPMTKQYDAKRTVPDFSTGYAFLRLGAGYSIPSTRKHKLAQQRIGPFKILGIVGKGKAYRLQLPPHYGIHPVISVVHLEPAPVPGSDPYKRPVATNDVAPVAGPASEPEWEIDAIVGKRSSKRGRKKKTEFLVRWKGYGTEWDSWYSDNDLPNAR